LAGSYKSEVTDPGGALEAIRRCGKISALLSRRLRAGSARRSGRYPLYRADQNIAKIAVIGEEEWRDLAYALAKGCQAAVEYFLPADLAKARACSKRPDSRELEREYWESSMLE
jgi:hypothetical protein